MKMKVKKRRREGVVLHHDAFSNCCNSSFELCIVEKCLSSSFAPKTS